MAVVLLYRHCFWIRGNIAGHKISNHDDVIKLKHFPRYWPFARGIKGSPMNSPHKGQWRGALMSSLIWINGWVNNREAGDLRRHRAHYDTTVMWFVKISSMWSTNIFPSLFGWSNVYLDTSRPEQTGLNFADDIFKWIFLKSWISSSAASWSLNSLQPIEDVLPHIVQHCFS